MSETILTLANGRGIDLLNPTPADVDWEAYAEQLAKEARYNGATRGKVFSVAQHLCIGADAIMLATQNTPAAGYFLLHDVPEAVLKDDTTPKKRAIAAIAEREFGVLAPTILAAFDRLTELHDIANHAAAGLPWPMPAEIAAVVKTYDLRCFVTEWRDLMPGVPHPNWAPYAAVEPLPHRKISCWDWKAAKFEWLTRAQFYLPALQRGRA